MYVVSPPLFHKCKTITAESVFILYQSELRSQWQKIWTFFAPLSNTLIPLVPISFFLFSLPWFSDLLLHNLFICKQAHPIKGNFLNWDFFLEEIYHTFYYKSIDCSSLENNFLRENLCEGQVSNYFFWWLTLLIFYFAFNKKADFFLYPLFLMIEKHPSQNSCLLLLVNNLKAHILKWRILKR